MSHTFISGKISVGTSVDEDEAVKDKKREGGQSEAHDASSSEGNLETVSEGSLAFIGDSVVREDGNSHTNEA
jgi:hypothetical protein